MNDREWDSDARYFIDPTGETFMLHHPSDEKIEAVGLAFGVKEISAERYRELEDERMERDESVPTGGYEELEVT